MDDSTHVTDKPPSLAGYRIEAAAAPEAEGWESARPDVSLRVLFDDGGGCRVALVRHASGSELPEHPHAFDEHVYVLEGNVRDRGGAYGPGTYLLNPGGTRRRMWSLGGGLVLIHRLEPAQDPAAAEAPADEVFPRIDTRRAEAWESLHRGVDLLPLFEGPPGNHKAALLRYRPGASIPDHLLLGDEHIYVISGSQEDGRGCYGAGSYVFNPAGTRHWIASEEGCVALIHWRAPARFRPDRI